jgi:hypothetical protein
MKKLTLICFVALLSLALTVPVYALENQFGGYHRTRFVNQTDFDGDSDQRETSEDSTLKKEFQQTDARTRLYYTAVINDNLKFVNKFEFDWVWGDDVLGDVGADGKILEIKNSYLDFNFMDANFKMGTQGGVIHRGFVMDDDFSGVTVGYGGLTALYAKVDENTDCSGDDNQVWFGKYAIGMDGLTITPNVTYFDLADKDWIYFLGLDIDGSAGGLGYWATFIYEGGEVGVPDVDVAAYLIAGGASVALSDATDLHFEAFYATGQDDDEEDQEAFYVPAGQSYYWSEIMGFGIFDEQASNGSCADHITNIIAANVGVGLKLSDKLSVGADLWYAMLAEEVDGEDELGTEVDLSAKYTIVEGMSLDVVGAYLFAGDATGEDDPMEIGARFSISF